jgi:hypothetical protein
MTMIWLALAKVGCGASLWLVAMAYPVSSADLR